MLVAAVMSSRRPPKDLFIMQPGGDAPNGSTCGKSLPRSEKCKGRRCLTPLPAQNAGRRGFIFINVFTAARELGINISTDSNLFLSILISTCQEQSVFWFYLPAQLLHIPLITAGG